MVKRTTNTTWSTVDMGITMIDQTKIENLQYKREQVIFKLDELKYVFSKKILKILQHLVTLDKQIQKAKKGKTIRKRFKQK